MLAAAHRIEVHCCQIEDRCHRTLQEIDRRVEATWRNRRKGHNDGECGGRQGEREEVGREVECRERGETIELGKKKSKNRKSVVGTHVKVEFKSKF